MCRLLLVLGLLLSLFCTPLGIFAAQEGTLDAGMVNPGYHEKPDWFKLSFLDIREDIADAHNAGKRIMLYFHQDGCPYCAKLLQDNFSQRTIVEKTRRHFDVIAINMWGDREVVDLDGNAVTEKRFAEQMKVMFTPTLLFLDADGASLLRINGYYFPARFDAALDYVSGNIYRQMRFVDYINQRAPVAASGKLHVEADFLQPPYDLSSRTPAANRYLLVLFEQKQCQACDEMHLDIFRRKEMQEALQHFDIAVVDMHSRKEIITPGGEKLPTNAWAKQMDIRFAPSMVFFDTTGKEVFRTEAYLKAFHQQTAMRYVYSEAYKVQSSFQRFVQSFADELRAQGIEVDIMK
jgi:thioredoxin-related protein